MGVTPLVASSQAMRFVLRTLPALRRRRLMVTVSPLSTAPFTGPLSEPSEAPAGTTLTKALETAEEMEAVLLAVTGSDSAAETAAETGIRPTRVGETTMLIVA